MENKGVILLGLGPGDSKFLTRQAWSILENATEIYLRTKQHPVVVDFPAELKVFSFDELYERGEQFEVVYDQIVTRVLQLGQRPQGVVYAVPGHPLVAEATGPEIMRRARDIGLPVIVVDGMSFIEPVLTALGVDLLPHTVLVDALELADLHVPPFPPSAPALVAQIYSRQVASEVKLTLMATYPDEHPVRLVHSAGSSEQQVESLPLYEIDRSPATGLLTVLYVPPLSQTAAFEAFQEVIAHLRAPDGCPWDREQTHQSLRPHLLEEAYETLAALDADDPLAMQEELGDLLLQILLHAQIASEFGEFNMADVVQGITTKIINRHPHVFSDLTLEGVNGVLQNWEKLKAAERLTNGNASKGLLDGVAVALPALVQAYEFQKRAARVGFDWPALPGVVEKVLEELTEFQQAQSQDDLEAELGDLLFAVVNLARWQGIDPESALRAANDRFRRRFSYIERAVAASGRQVSELSLEEWETLWQAAKAE